MLFKSWSCTFLTLIAFSPTRFKSLYQYHAQGHILTHDVNGIQCDYIHLPSTVMQKGRDSVYLKYSGYSIHFIESESTCFASEYYKASIPPLFS